MTGRTTLILFFMFAMMVVGSSLGFAQETIHGAQVETAVVGQSSHLGYWASSNPERPRCNYKDSEEPVEAKLIRYVCPARISYGDLKIEKVWSPDASDGDFDACMPSCMAGNQPFCKTYANGKSLASCCYDMCGRRPSLRIRDPLGL